MVSEKNKKTITASISFFYLEEMQRFIEASQKRKKAEGFFQKKVLLQTSP